MGLDVPDLDDRAYADLLEDARKRIPVHAPEWTDHNVHDPGITILELLAFLAETHTYQLDRVSDAHRRKYLELVNAEPRPPQQATVALSLSTPAEADVTTVPEGAELLAETPSGRREHFRTTESILPSAAAVAAVVVESGGGRTDHTRANESDGLHFRAFGADPAAGDALYLGFDADPFASPSLELWVDFHEANLPAPASHGDEPVTVEPSHRCVWEHCTDPENWYDEGTWEPLDPEPDETNHLYGGGRVTLPRPAGWRGERARIADHDESLYWVRCRLARLDVADPPAPHNEVPPQLNRVAVDVVRARHERLIENETIRSAAGEPAETTAEPSQQFELEAAPVQSADLSVGGEAWETVADFDVSTPDSRHVRLEKPSGTLTFGDGRRGAIPSPWQSLEADYVAGGGPAGNLPADATWRFVDDAYDAIDVRPTAPPSGGREAESIEAALSRARAQRRVPFRAVTEDDHAYIATHTPGLRFGRAAVAAAPGGTDAVTVVVVPYSPDGRLPVPSAGFRDAVEAHLFEHALLTERVRVVGPTYVPVTVQATVEPEAGADREALRRAARDRIEDFLDPLSGFEGEGWPFGRPVYRSELYEHLETMERVVDAVDVGISTGGDVAIGDRGDTLPNLTGVGVAIHEEREDCGRGA